MAIHIRNVNVWTDGCFTLRDEVVVGNPASPRREIDGSGKYLIPGLVDMHVHFRQPGFEYKETIASGSRAAAAGGFTTVCTMPNLNPAPDSAATIAVQKDIIAHDSVIEVLPYATITLGRRGDECVDFEACEACGIAGFSDDGSGIQSEDVMRRAMEACAPHGYLIAAHCEVNSLLQGGYIHKGEYAATHGHRGICSESEWQEIKRDIALAEQTGARLHVCHISTKESVALIREAKARGVKVTCETAPHYLVFSDADLQEDGRFKMNPPIRSEEDREALIEGIKDGTIDVVATDHAPHSADEKNRGLEKSAMGVTGIEISLPAIYTYLVDKGIISIERMMALMATRGREILHLAPAEMEGEKADVALVDFSEEYKLDSTQLLSMGHSTPFDGMPMKGRVVLTVSKGKIAYER